MQPAELRIPPLHYTLNGNLGFAINNVDSGPVYSATATAPGTFTPTLEVIDSGDAIFRKFPDNFAYRGALPVVLLLAHAGHC